VLRTTDRGRTWRALEHLPGSPVGVWDAGGGHIYVVGGSGTIFHSADGGANGKEQESHVDGNFIRVWGTREVYAVGSSGTVVRTRDNGRHWVALPTAGDTSLSDVWGSDGVVRASGEGGALYQLE
jgi:photosystem II stability/assembly factor-like uncharacterized protein